MFCVDAHQHFWKYSASEYEWIDDSVDRLRRDFMPADLAAEMRAARVNAAVSVQARQSLAETDWLLDLADQHDFLAGVVGWAPIAGPSFAEDLERIATHPKLKGLRHLLQGEEDAYMLQMSFQHGLDQLLPTGLVYDIVIYERQLPSALELVDRNPRQVFVLDHVAKPKIQDGVLSPWRENMEEMASRPNVYCKLSGMVTEADRSEWTPADLAPYFDTVLEAFGPERLLAGSDWPVCTVAASYPQWWQTLRDALGALSPSEQEKILGGNTVRVYNLKSTAEGER